VPHMSQSDALMLAALYGKFAEELVAYQSDHADDDDVDNGKLSTLISAVTQHSRDLANDAAATSFNDTTSAVQQLQKVTSDANDELKSLSAEVGRFTRVADITAGIINIGVGLALQNPDAAIKAAVGLGTTLAKGG
jgi:hypothetical protein